MCRKKKEWNEHVMQHSPNAMFMSLTPVRHACSNMTKPTGVNVLKPAYVTCIDQSKRHLPCVLAEAAGFFSGLSSCSLSMRVCTSASLASLELTASSSCCLGEGSFISTKRVPVNTQHTVATLFSAQAQHVVPTLFAAQTQHTVAIIFVAQALSHSHVSNPTAAYSAAQCQCAACIYRVACGNGLHIYLPHEKLVHLKQVSLSSHLCFRV